jgi:hypothetical protein
MLIDGIISRLQADTGVTALAAGRIYEGELPRGYTLPAVCVHSYGGDQDSEMDGPVGVREDQVQFDAYGTSATQARQTAEAVRASLVAFTGALPDGTVVQLVMVERSMAMPFLPHADGKGIANRFLIGLKVVSAA